MLCIRCLCADASLDYLICGDASDWVLYLGLLRLTSPSLRVSSSCIDCLPLDALNINNLLGDYLLRRATRFYNLFLLSGYHDWVRLSHLLNRLALNLWGGLLEFSLARICNVVDNARLGSCTTNCWRLQGLLLSLLWVYLHIDAVLVIILLG